MNPSKPAARIIPISSDVLENGKRRLLKSFHFYVWKKSPPETVDQRMVYIQHLGDYLKVFASDIALATEGASWSSQIYSAVMKDLRILQVHMQKTLQGEDSQLEAGLQYLVS